MSCKITIKKIQKCLLDFSLVINTGFQHFAFLWKSFPLGDSKRGEKCNSKVLVNYQVWLK